MSVRIVYKDIAPGAAEDATITTTDATDFSEPSLLPFAANESGIATLELNSWLLDGSRDVLDEQPIAFWSSAISDENGEFETPPEITITFEKRYTSQGINLTFDPATGEYCSSVTITWYNSITEIKQITFTPDRARYFCKAVVEAYDKIVIRLNATSLPGRYAKLSHITFGIERLFEREELRNVRVVEQASIISDEVAINTLDFTLDSGADVNYMFQLKQPVYAYDGDSLIGVFYIDDSSRHGVGLYDVSCIDAIGVLDDDPFPAGMYTAYSARTLLEDILGGHFKLELAQSMETSTVTGYMPPCSRREALQQVAFALGAIVDTSGSEAVRVYKDREESPKRIPLSRTYTGGDVGTSAIVTAVKVTAHTYSTTGEGNDTVEVDGVTYYHTTEVTTLNNPNATASDKQNVKKVENATLVTPANAAQIAQHLYDYFQKRNTQKIRIVMDGEKPGDHIAAYTPWGTMMNGYISSMSIVLSGIAAADCEVIGLDVESVGDTEIRYSGEFMSGGI